VIDFLKRLFGLAGASERPLRPAAKPPLPEAELEIFKDWFLTQRKPAVALIPNPDGPIGKTGSRLGGPAWLTDDENWPLDKQNTPLEFLAQLDCVDCRELTGYPNDGIIQFFIGRDDLFGADFDNLLNGSALIRWCDTESTGALHQPPPLEELGGAPFSDFSPFMKAGVRNGGLALHPQPFEDWIDQSIKDAELRVNDLYKQYDIATLERFVESEELERPLRHQTGGYPAFTQSDIRYQADFADYDHVLLRLTSDDAVLWGDVGEAVFMIHSADLARRDFTRVAYSWDCC
jgi:uncharacterized protein YwqG